MKALNGYVPFSGALLAGAVVLMAPEVSWGCACGCGIFDVGTSSMFPSGAGRMLFLNYDYQDQNQNWHGSSRAPAANNDDKEIETDFLSVGLQYMLNREWGVQAEVPYDIRSFRGVDESGSPFRRNWSQLGDIRLRGIYTGLSPDLSAGVTFGVKLPTGSFRYAEDVVDRDTQIGTGSTDALLGGFYRGELSQAARVDWFAQAELDVPTFIQDHYRPGVELDAAAGLYWKGLSLGAVKIIPVGQILFSERTSDSGANAAEPVASGYQRLLVSPGIEIDAHPVKFYADVEFPMFQNFTGDQLAAPVLVKVSLAWMF